MGETNILDEIQPIDSYVRNILKTAKERYGLDIDLDKPTRSQRLEVALAMKDEANGFYSMEIMVGRRVGSSEQLALTFGIFRLAEEAGSSDPKGLYGGSLLDHQYYPK